MPRVPVLIFILNLTLFVSCNDTDEPEIPKKSSSTIEERQNIVEESLPIEEGTTINGRTFTLNSTNSEAVDFGDMYEMKLKLEDGLALADNPYEVRIYLVKTGELKKYTIQNFSPSRTQMSIRFSCVAEIIYRDTIYYGYEGSVNFFDYHNGKMDLAVQVKAESLKGIPIELSAGIKDLKIAPFISHDCFMDKVVSPYGNGTGVVARYYYTSEGNLKYVHMGGEDVGESYYFSYLNGTIKEWWHAMTSPPSTGLVHKIDTKGIVNLNPLKRIESVDYLTPTNAFFKKDTYFYNETGLLEKVEERFSVLSTYLLKYSGKNITECVWILPGQPTSIITLDDYDDKPAPGRQLTNRVHKNFFYRGLFKFDGVYLPLSENNFRHSISDIWGHHEERFYTYKYDALGNTTEISNNLSGTSNGFKISYKYCGDK